jgi:transcription elongation GreA/GreB family factor
MKIIATEKGIENLKKEIEELKKRLETVRDDKNVAYHSMGDQWHDNPAFVNLEQEERQVYKLLMDTEKKLASVEIHKTSSKVLKEITIGSIFHCKTESNGLFKDVFYEITGHGESSIPLGKVRYDSPLAKTLIGAVKGESRVFQGAKNATTYTVIEFFDHWDSVELYKETLNLG